MEQNSFESPTQVSNIEQPREKYVIPEILAPAGGREQFLAALNAGADAVYLGLGKFNARSRAENFTMQDLRELVPLAHARGMKVLVTLNILLKEAELELLLEDLLELQWVGVHAVIVQDLGVAKIVRQYFPNIRLHASTQLAIHNLDGVRKAAELGFKRIVLARELTAQEIKRIHQETIDTEIEIEAFCHGSLCYSYSGLCFFSGAEDARSGNRGECAYTCRQPYKILSEPGHGFLFSMKDLNTSDDLDKLIKAGVHTLKIEGRKKDAQYVTTSVGLYRQKLNEFFGYDTSPSGVELIKRNWQDDMSYSFHRGMTQFYLNTRYTENVIDLNNPTHKGKLVGKVSSVKGRKLTFTTSIPLESYDGLRIEAAKSAYHAKPQHGDAVTSKVELANKRYENKEIQFSLRDFTVNGKKSHIARSKDKVELTVSENLKGVSSGDLLYKTRSNELKRHTEDMVRLPKDSRLRALSRISYRVLGEARGESFKITVSCLHGVEEILSISNSFSSEKSEQSSSLKKDLFDLLQILGEAQFAADHIEFNGDFNYFVPKSQLKKIKKALNIQLPKAVSEYNYKLRHDVTQAFKADRFSGVAVTQCVYSIKIDRLEYLSFIDQYLEISPDFPLKEVIFEPKRAFFGDQSWKNILDVWTQLSTKYHFKPRFSIPTVIRAWDEPLLKIWLEQFGAVSNAFEVGNLGALSILQKQGIDLKASDLAADFTLYQLNTEAMLAIRNLGVGKGSLSIEDDMFNIKDNLQSLPKGYEPMAIVYKDTPLFIAEACSLTALHDGCPTAKVCGYRDLEIENHQGERFVIAHESCKSVVYGKNAFSISHQQDYLMQLGVSEFRLDFLTKKYDQHEFVSVLNQVLRKERVKHTIPVNFERKLL